MIELENVSKIFNKGKDTAVYAINNISMIVEDGDMSAITGPSGSGKSTLLHLIAGLLNPSSGDIRFDGASIVRKKDWEKCKYRNKEIGVIMQDYGLIEAENVMNNICLPLMISNNYNKKTRLIAQNWADELNIGKLVTKKIYQLSGGQKQRVAIARALVTGAKIILADEPTGALDSENTRILMEVFKKLNNRGITIIVVTHDTLVADYCKKKYCLIDGMISNGAPQTN